MLWSGWALAAAAAESVPVGKAARVPLVLERAIVRLENTSQRGDWRTPWNPGRPQRSTGSGFVIEGGRILTNAHVVADSKNLVITLHGDATPHEARIVALGHDCDLALVEPVEKGLLDARVPLRFSTMPDVGEEVTALGYPAGGRWLSSTTGVVSRIDYTGSVHAGSAHLAVQTDAAINPGNSGGPVLRDGRVVGVAFQANADLENVGFFIPVPIVQHFLDDVDALDGYQGFPSLDVNVSKLDSPAARRRAGMAEGETGVRIDFVHPGSPAAGVLRAGDILLSLAGETIFNDGTFLYRDQSLQFAAVLDRWKVGDRIPARVLRDGARLSVEVPVGRSQYPLRAYETLPRYFVYAGVVFVPLDREYFEAAGREAGTEISYEFGLRQLEEAAAPLPPRVVMLRRLDHPANATWAVAGNAIVERVNDVEVHTLEDVISALEGNAGRFHVFRFAYGGRTTVLDRAVADGVNKAILDQYGVRADRRL